MSTTTADESKYRLPTNVKPIHYNITIKTDLETQEFQGYTTVDLDVLEDTSSLVFNTTKLNIHDVVVHSEAQKSQETQTVNTDFDQKLERAIVQVANPLKKGSKVQLRVWFDGKITDELMGYYTSSYKDNGKKIYYALTQFEPTAARRAFPSWDEPLLKATFDITLISRAETVSLSNMPAASEDSLDGTTDEVIGKFFKDSDPAGWKVTKFETTPPMSTYIVAYANGPFKHLETSYTSPLSGKKRILRVYATSDLIDQTKFGLDVGAKVLLEYEKVFDIEYPLPKLDTLVAHDFDSGAMENWGLITGRTTAYCVDEERADVSAKKRIASTQSHEVAHMWFGNITTMSWWDNLWLNEGFATLMGEVIILNKVFPEWKVYASFYIQHTERALSLDAKRSSHPIQVAVPNAEDINQIFDSLSYSKAASVLRMLSVYVGEDKFLKGVSIYLKKHLYANSVAEDLWRGIQEATGLDISELMNNWILKTGFPVVTVTETPEGIHLRQDRFIATGDVTEEENSTIWQIPLTILSTDTDGKTTIDNKAILKTREMTYKLDVNKPWKINAGNTGFYRVLYTPERLKKLGEEALRPGTAFTVPDRLGLVTDAFSLASSGLGSTSGALSLINGMRGETEYLPWSGIVSQLRRVSRVWWDQGDNTRDDMQTFLRVLSTPIVRRLGYEYPKGEDVDNVQLRTLAISNAANAGAKEYNDAEDFAAFFKDKDTSKLTMILPQSLDGIRAKSGWLKVRADFKPLWILLFSLILMMNL
ncbi:hypothetical protein M422DRAFT_75548 [Sphaerobolus stellatus SS14]|uniref:Aminopeptidase n=1 Tax=Sphaerobolus stellatus (strain SS14) TaxID=990650 RepID=A0A0C9UH66_SPHS4|nr:hypothetical protein M422DRAFT_75548 [Sphaerobolus stellatus SS14]